jgi:dienelactone hydrolase
MMAGWPPGTIARVGGRLTAAVLTLALLASGCGGDDGADDGGVTRLVQPVGCLQEGDGIRRVDFDGVPAAVAGEGPLGIVALNGVGGSMCQWEPYARELAAQGARVLMFDYVDDPVDEALAAERWLLEDGATDIALIGTSLGGGVAVRAGARSEPAAVVTLSAVNEPDGPLGNIVRAARRLRVPTLHVGSREDGSTYFARDTRRLHAATGSDVKERILVPGGEHGVDILAAEGGDDVKAQIHAFLRTAIP